MEQIEAFLGKKRKPQGNRKKNKCWLKKEQPFAVFSTRQLMWEPPAVSSAISQKKRRRDYRAWEQGGECITDMKTTLRLCWMKCFQSVWQQRDNCICH